MDELHWWSSSSGRIEFQLPRRCIDDCSHSGACDTEVFNWALELQGTLKVESNLVISELTEYGCWTRAELESLTRFELVEKLIWIAANDLSDKLPISES